MEEVGFEYMGEYFLKRQNMVTQYISMRPILGLCKETVRRSRCGLLGDGGSRR